jgi:hypothetical protein
MKSLISKLTIASGNLQSNNVRLVFVLVTLGLFIFGAAAPEDGGWIVR